MEADYDFSEIKSDELLACDLYEYARESNAASGAALGLRKQFIKNAGINDPLIFGQPLHAVQSYLLMTLAWVSGFPDKPWQKLSWKDKNFVFKYLAQYSHIWRYAETAHNPPLSFSINEPESMTLEMWKKRSRERLPSRPDTDPVKSGFFSVNLKYGRPILIEEFEKWLTHFEGKPMSETQFLKNQPSQLKQPGRKSHRDALNALAAMRLRFHCETFAQAKKIMDNLKNKPDGLYYSRRDSFNRACVAAVTHFDNRLAWLNSEKPLHFTDGWGRKN
jgi:hypothetical protein